MYWSFLSPLLHHPDPAASSQVTGFMASSANLTRIPHIALLLILTSLLRTLVAMPLLFLDGLIGLELLILCLPFLSQSPCL